MVSEEQWRPIPSCPGYEASTQGRLRSLTAGHGRRAGDLLNQRMGSNGYLTFTYSVGGKTTKTVHGAVAEAFHGPRPEGMQVRHRNGDSLDNRPANLTYGTNGDNQNDRAEHGRHFSARDECSAGHPYTPENTRVTKKGARVCRACMRVYGARSKARARAR